MLSAQTDLANGRDPNAHSTGTLQAQSVWHFDKAAIFDEAVLCECTVARRKLVESKGEAGNLVSLDDRSLDVRSHFLNSARKVVACEK